MNPSPSLKRQAKLRELGIDEDTDYRTLVYAEEERRKREELECQEREKNQEHWRKSRLGNVLMFWWLSYGGLALFFDQSYAYGHPCLLGGISLVIAFLIVALLETVDLSKK
jgi:hypothetical protein